MKTRARAKTRNKLADLAGMLLYASENKTGAQWIHSFQKRNEHKNRR